MIRSIDEILALQSDPRAGTQAVVDLAVQQPGRLSALLEASARLPRSHAAINAALALVPDEELQSIADESVAALREGADKHGQAADLVALLGLQAPQTLRPHLEALWDLRPNEGWVGEEWPWRAAQPGEDIDRLATHLSSPDAGVRRRAWERLVESRTPEGWSAALASLGTAVPEDWAIGTLLGVGIERQASGVRRLFSSPACHIVFPEGFLRPPSWMGIEGRIEDPTWHPQGPVVGRGRFGGSVAVPCKICRRDLHRLVALDEPPATAPGPLEVVTCLSCLGWSEGQLFFRHEDGAVQPAGREVPEQEPEFPTDPFPETSVTFVESLPRWQLQDWGASNARQNLNRVSGEPTWIQSPDFPGCPGCRRRMTFLLQLDSDSLDAIDGAPAWFGGGILYAFWCATCSLSGTYSQCT